MSQLSALSTRHFPVERTTFFGPDTFQDCPASRQTTDRHPVHTRPQNQGGIGVFGATGQERRREEWDGQRTQDRLWHSINFYLSANRGLLQLHSANTWPSRTHLFMLFLCFFFAFSLLFLCLCFAFVLPATLDNRAGEPIVLGNTWELYKAN